MLDLVSRRVHNLGLGLSLVESSSLAGLAMTALRKLGPALLLLTVLSCPS